MLEETRKAVELSIEKWENVAIGKETERLSSDCALCARFLRKTREDICPLTTEKECPGACCNEWKAWNNHYYESHRGRPRQRAPGCTKCDELSMAMLDRLKGLLEDDVQ